MLSMWCGQSRRSTRLIALSHIKFWLEELARLIFVMCDAISGSGNDEKLKKNTVPIARDYGDRIESL